jgi:ubiquinone/menaquinone biosynthesis C-methylase UbiE
MLASTTTYHASDRTAYERFLRRGTSVLATRLLDFAEFPPDGPLLDVGTGTGSLAVAMATRWPSRRIVGIDVAEPYIRYARSRSTASLLSFEVGEAARLPFCPGAFSGAAAQLVLNFIPNAEAAVREMRRVTRRSGRVEDYWQPLLGGQGPIGTYVAELSSDLRARIKDAVRRAYCAGSPDSERSLCATAWAVRGLVS